MPPPPLSPEDFQRLANVNDRTMDRLRAYVAVLEKWGRKINLVSDKGMADVWRRHVWDGLQVANLVPDGADSVIDLGSGAGFPGLVIAIARDLPVRLVESDGRKCVFLAEANRAAETNAVIENARIESIPPAPHDVVTSRGLAPLPKLLGMAEKFVDGRTLCLFPKGQNVVRELTDAHKIWMMRVEQAPSETDPAGVILRLEGLRRRHGSE